VREGFALKQYGGSSQFYLFFLQKTPPPAGNGVKNKEQLTD
jgi:hypothetical protein